MRLGFEHLEIRPARKADLARIISIEQQFGADAYDREYFLQCLKRCKIFWVLEQDQSIQGYLIAQYRKNGKSVHLYSIAIDQTVHRTGLGLCLLQSFEDHCVDRGLNTVTLECREDSIQARGFYVKNLYVLVGKRENYYADQSAAVCLEKHLI